MSFVQIFLIATGISEVLSSGLLWSPLSSFGQCFSIGMVFPFLGLVYFQSKLLFSELKFYTEIALQIFLSLF